jgi:adenylate cyclase class IV
MPIENELRYSIRDHRFDQTLRAIDRELHLGRFVLEPSDTRVHADTYFDRNEWLLDNGWSLRVRQSNDDVRVTLKRPLPTSVAHGAVRDELENPRDGSFADVVERIIRILGEAGALTSKESTIRARLMLEGVFTAFRSCGLHDLFTVETTRHAWVATFDGANVAEIVLDDSSYNIGGAAEIRPIRECRMEVELLDPSNQDLLGEFSRCIQSRFGFEEVHDSKFDRGMVYYSTRKLLDKMEVKITVKELDDYRAIINYLDNTEDFVRDYHFTKLSYQRIADVYFDSADYKLFRAGCYLRLREEQKIRELTFRRLTKDVKYGQVLQQEIVARGDGEAFSRAWRLICDWLVRTADVHDYGGATDLTKIETTLQNLGLRRVLEVDIVRLPWRVSRIDPQKSWRSENANHVAKVKYDQISYRRPGDEANVLRNVEFEVAGVGDQNAGLQEAQLAAYETFVSQFYEACAHASSDGRAVKEIYAKYFHGMLGLGIVDETPEWVADGRLKVSLSSLLRETSIRQHDQAENSPRQISKLTTQTSRRNVPKIFISHSSEDSGIALALIELLRLALSLPTSDIRCTSVAGYGLSAGVSIESVLRGDVGSADVFIGLLSRRSLHSLYVLFELGARWGSGKPIIPVLLSDVSPSDLKGPLADIHSIKISNSAASYDLISQVGDILMITPESPASVMRYAERLAGSVGSSGKPYRAAAESDQLPEA